MSSEGNGSSCEVVFIGASQAGLAMGYLLAWKALTLVILDAGPEIDHLWCSRWTRSCCSPHSVQRAFGDGISGPEDTYPSRDDDVVSCLQAHAATFDLPVRLASRVTLLTRSDDGYIVATPQEVFETRQVVVATGPFQAPFTPLSPPSSTNQCFSQRSRSRPSKRRFRGDRFMGP